MAGGPEGRGLVWGCRWHDIDLGYKLDAPLLDTFARRVPFFLLTTQVPGPPPFRHFGKTFAVRFSMFPKGVS